MAPIRHRPMILRYIVCEVQEDRLQPCRVTSLVWTRSGLAVRECVKRYGDESLRLYGAAGPVEKYKGAYNESVDTRSSWPRRKQWHSNKHTERWRREEGATHLYEWKVIQQLIKMASCSFRRKWLPVLKIVTGRKKVNLPSASQKIQVMYTRV